MKLAVRLIILASLCGGYAWATTAQKASSVSPNLVCCGNCDDPSGPCCCGGSCSAGGGKCSAQ